MGPIHRFPAGFKFMPTEEEILFYLQCKVNDVKPAKRMLALKEIDIYKFENPEDLFEDADEDVVYVFTKLKKVVKNGKRFERAVGSCVWKGSDRGQETLFGGTRRLWTKNFSFEYKDSGVKLGYNMKEFSLDGSLLLHAKYPDYVLCLIKRKSKDKGESITENLQEEIQDPVLPTDRFGFPALPAQTESDNGSWDIGSSSMIPNTEVRQYEEKNETIAYLPWPLPAGGCANQYPNTPYNEGCHNQYQNMPSNEVCHNQYQKLPSAELYTHHQVTNGLTAGVPLADEGYQTQSQQRPTNEVFQMQYQEMPSNVVDQDQYQSKIELIADSPLADAACRNQNQEINGLIAYVPSNPYFEGNRNQEDLWTNSIVAFTQPEELDEEFNIRSDLNLITELASVPTFSYLGDNMIYSEFTSQPTVPPPIGQPTPAEGFELPFSGAYLQKIQKATATPPFAEIFPTTAPIATMPSVTVQQTGETKPAGGSEILFSQGIEMEIKEPTTMVPSTTVPPLVNSEVGAESMLPMHREEQTDAYPQQDMDVDGGQCTEFGTSVAATLRGFKEEALDKIEDPMIANHWNLENLREFFMPVYH